MKWVSFFLGVFVGFIAEWLVDVFYWRGQHGQKAAELQTAREGMSGLDARYQNSLRAAGVAQQEIEAAKGDMAAMSSELSGLKGELAAAQEAGEAAVAQLAESQEHLQANEADAAQLSARLGEADETIAALQSELAAAQSELAAAQTEAAALAQKLAEMAGGAAAAEVELRKIPGDEAESLPLSAMPSSPDDLKIIEGIGAKIAGILHDAGIHTFAQLATTPVEQLQAILSEAGPRFQLAEPATWPEQAAVAATGNREALQRLQSSLKGGRYLNEDA